MKRLLSAITIALLFCSQALAFPPTPPGSSASSATTSSPGTVRLATDAETVTGSATDKVTTPANITARLAAPPAIGGTTPAAGSFTTLTASGVIDGLSTVEAVNGKTIAVKSGYYIATGTSNFVVPTPSSAGGNQYCFKQANAGTNAITVIPVHTSSVQLGKTDNSGYCDAGDKLVSGGAATDQLCIVALDATHYLVFSSTGTWTCTAH